MPKPKVYRKTKPTNGSGMMNYKVNEGGGNVEGIIIGPLSSVGTVATTPEADQGKDKGLEAI